MKLETYRIQENRKRSSIVEEKVKGAQS